MSKPVTVWMQVAAAFLGLSVSACQWMWDKQYREQTESIIAAAANGTLDKGTVKAEHLRCFKCQRNMWPTSLQELVAFQPGSDECKRKFALQPINPQQYVADAQISVAEKPDRTTLLFARPGVAWNTSRNESFVSHTFKNSALPCEAQQLLPADRPASAAMPLRLVGG